MNQLSVGDTAPDFNLADKDEASYALSELGSEYVVLFFYPKDATPG